jgi:hypothetical protein
MLTAHPPRTCLEPPHPAAEAPATPLPFASLRRMHLPSFFAQAFWADVLRDISRARAQFVEDLFLRRESSLVMLGEDFLVAQGDVEDPSATADDRRVDIEFLPDLGRQTGSAGQKVSNAAVFDRDLHKDS